jgi:translation initiation factor 6
LIVSTNQGAGVHPSATDQEIQVISESLKVDVQPATVNGGIPYLSSGIIANSKSMVVGSLTTGPELMILSRAFNL